MPFMQAFVERLNYRFNRWNISDVDAALLEAGPGKSLVTAAAGSSKGSSAIQASAQEQNYLDTQLASGELEKVRGALHKAVTQEPRVPVQFLWVPDDQATEVTAQIWEVPGAGGSMPGVSVLLKGPPPGKAKAE